MARPLVAGVTAFVMLVIVVLLSMFGGIDQAIGADFQYQCDTALGPDPSSTMTLTPASGSSPVSPSAALTVNRYAPPTGEPLDADATDRQRACLSAMRSAPHQGAPLQTIETGFAARCAREIIASLLNRAGGAGAPTRPLAPATMTAAVIRQASAAAGAGRCEPLESAGFDDASPPRLEVSANVASGPLRCPNPTAGGTVILPDGLAAQSLCGQLVAASATSPGDLVFWGYQRNAPTRVAVAIDTTTVAGVDPVTGDMIRVPMPGGRDVHVKRVLGGAS
ncbi:hypothetical protein ACFXO9_30830 [Nocardia tengchongensis]|uniref:hypothetical protein n=1 Tax=Nocardia tengchongensis TaxID=2055889 RepID=UPI0036A64688